MDQANLKETWKGVNIFTKAEVILCWVSKLLQAENSEMNLNSNVKEIPKKRMKRERERERDWNKNREGLTERATDTKRQ